MGSHKVQDFEKTLILILLNINNILKNLGLNILHYPLFACLVLYLGHKLQNGKELIQIQLHLIDFTSYHI